jgi:arginyl-tRNA synthetase
VLDKPTEKSLKIISEKSPELKDKKKVAEAIGVGAVVFSALINNRIKDNVFSYDKILNFDGETGPYLQYTYARCNSISEKADVAPENENINICYNKKRGIEASKKTDGNDAENKDKTAINASHITGNEAYELVKMLRRYPEVLKAAKDNYEPSYVTRYLIDIAQAFNKFYIADRILDENQEIRTARVALTRAVMSVLKNGFEIIGIKPVDHM